MNLNTVSTAEKRIKGVGYRGGGTAFSAYPQLNVRLTGNLWCDLPGFCAVFVHILAANGCRSVVEQGVTGDAAE
jgi:hypothetical protein